MYNYHIGLQAINRRDRHVLEGNVSVRFKNPTELVSGPSEIFD
jgi:hypothetical protein